MMILGFPHHFQKTRITCGPACVRAIAEFYGKRISEEALSRRVRVTTRWGTSRPSMLKLLRSVGVSARVFREGTIRDITEAIGQGHPVLINYKVPKYEEDHYAIIKGFSGRKLFFSDPSRGKTFSLTHNAFVSRWKNQRLRKKYTGWMAIVSAKRKRRKSA